MDRETEKNAPATQTGFTASGPAKRLWHTPEIDEVDFAETEATHIVGGADGFMYTS